MTTVFDVGAELEKSRGLAPKPPREEQEGRLARARAAMEQHGLDALLVWGSAGANSDPIRYLAGYVHVFPTASSLLLVPLDRDPVLLVDQPWHLDEARRMSWVEDVRSYPNPARRWLADELRAAIRDAVSGAGLAKASIGVFDAEMPAVYTGILEQSLPEARFGDATPVWQDLVASPSAYDAENIRRTVSVADTGLSAAVAAAAAGVPEYEMCLRSLESMASLGAEFLHGSGMSTHINVGSFSDAISNVRPFLFSARRLEEGQMFWLDLSASYAGCYTDTDRTISVGEPTRSSARSTTSPQRCTTSCSRRPGPGFGAEISGRRRPRSPSTPGTATTPTTSISDTPPASPPRRARSLRAGRLRSSAQGAS